MKSRLTLYDVVKPKQKAKRTRLNGRHRSTLFYSFSRQENWKKQDTFYKQILEMNSDNPDALHLLGLNAYQSGKYEAAIKLIHKAIQNDPTKDHFYSDLGSALMAVGKRYQAVAAYKKALSINPFSDEALNNLGIAFSVLGKLEEAIAVYQRALFIKPDNAEVLNNLGASLITLGNIDEAVVCLKRSLEIEPDHANAHNNLGNALKAQNSLEEAVASYQRSIAINPSNAEVYNNIGNTLNSLGKVDEAIDYLKRAVELDPTHGPANHLLNALTGEKTPIAPRAYVERLFDQYSARFDRHLVDKLQYKVPMLLSQTFSSLFTRVPQFQNAIDLGCGTGLAGLEFRDIADRITGIDLSPEMLNEARKKRIYDVLSVGDIVEFLNKTEEKYDLFIATDVFIYIGNLRPVFVSVQECSFGGAYFVFSTESTDENHYKLRQTGRYAHSLTYIQSLAKQYDFIVVMCQPTGIRKEGGQWIIGDVFVLKFKEKTCCKERHNRVSRQPGHQHCQKVEERS